MTSSPKSRKWYREPMVWLVLMIPAAAVVMGAVMLTLAISTYDGLVVDDYYKRGLQINRSIERDASAQAYGLASIVRLGESGGVIEASLDGDASFEAPEMVNLRLYHATRPGLDLHLMLRRIAPGRYLASRPELAPGRWYAQLDAEGWRLKGELQGIKGAQQMRLGRAAMPAR